MKKNFALLLAAMLVMVAVLGACGKKRRSSPGGGLRTKGGSQTRQTGDRDAETYQLRSTVYRHGKRLLQRRRNRSESTVV